MENTSGDGKTSPFGNGEGNVTNASPGGVQAVPADQKLGTSVEQQGSAPSAVPGGVNMTPGFAPAPSAPSADGAVPFKNVRG